MAKDKERSVNPAQAQRKLEKQKMLKKSKAELQSRRNEKLARRNPDRLQRQIDDLKAIEESGQTLKPKEKQALEELQRDYRAVIKAREALGDKAPKFGHRRDDDDSSRGRGGHGVLGKRQRDGQGQDFHRRRNDESDSSETDEDVRKIPMPRDTPPPVPRRNHHNNRNQFSGANAEPLNGDKHRGPHALPQKPDSPAPSAQQATPIQPQVTYSSAPVVRDLRQEAVSKFVPSVVRRNIDAVKGTGSKLPEPEELDRLEQAGYGVKNGNRTVEEKSGEGEDLDELARLEAEAEQFRRETEAQSQMQMQDQAQTQSQSKLEQPSNATETLQEEETRIPAPAQKAATPPVPAPKKMMALVEDVSDDDW